MSHVHVLSQGLQIEKFGSCVVVRMTNNSNVLTSQFIEGLHSALDTVESYQDAKCVVTTGHGKYFSTGVDVSLFESSSHDSITQVLSALQQLLYRVLTFPLVTVAAINGHCTGGGAMLALAHDYQIMRSDKGWFSIPIVRLKHTLPLGLLNLAKAKLPQPGFHTAVVTGKRYTAKEARDAGFIKEVSMDNSKLVDRAVRVGGELSQTDVDRTFLSNFKHDLYHSLCQSLKQSPVVISHI